MAKRVIPQRGIVKVQISLGGSPRRVLIYNQDHTILYEANASRKLLRVMGKRLKAFFHFHMEGTIISLDTDERCPQQDW